MPHKEYFVSRIASGEFKNHPNFKFIKAFAEGLAVEWVNDSGIWKELKDPSFNSNEWRYRIKGKLPTKRFMD